MSDTSEITSGSLVHYDSSHIQTRRDFMGLCQYNREEFAERRKQEPNQECMAKIVRLIETLTDHAKAEWKLKAMAAEEKGLHKPFLPKRFPVALSNEVIVRLLYRTFGESTVRNSLNYLLEIGYIGREQEKKNAIPLYWLEQKYVQALLKAQAEVTLAGYEFRPPSYQGAISYPDGVISDPSSVNSRPGHSYPGSESTDNNIGNRDKKYRELPKKEDTMVASPNVDATAHASSDFLPEETHENDAQASRTTADPDPLPGSSVDTHAFVGATPDVEDDTPTAHRLPAIKIGATHGNSPATDHHALLPDQPRDQVSGHPTQAVTSASTPGEPDSPPAAETRHSLQGPKDGAATGSSSEPRASGKQLPLSLKEDESHIKPETPRERERRIEQRQKEIWALVEEGLQTKFSRTQRQSKANQEGMEHLVEDETDDETIKIGLERLTDFWRLQFNLAQFHLHLPGLHAAKAPVAAKDGSVAQADERQENAKRLKRAFAEQRALVEAEQQALRTAPKLQA